MNAARTSNSRDRARGYTLLEAALAISISMVLLYAMYRASTMHYVSVSTGREIAEQTQIARGVMDRMRKDLRSVFTAWTPQTSGGTQGGGAASTAGASGAAGGSGTTGGTTGAAASSAGSAATSVTVQSDYNPAPGGVLGSESAITLAVLNSTEEVDFSAGNSQTSGRMPFGDVRMVRYWLATERNPAPDGRVGLVREQILRIPDLASSTGVQAEAVEVIAEEVTGIQFRYYDGSDWVNSWDASQTSGPLAVEALIQMLLPATAGGINAGNWQGTVATANPPSAAETDDANRNKTLVTFRVAAAMPPAADPASAGP